MRKIFIFFLLVSLLALPIHAHPGNTDANGGHYDRSTGGYHYHHGYSAHQHYDMDGDGVIDCPYNFVDKTWQNAGSSSDGSSGGSYSGSSSGSSSGIVTRPITGTGGKTQVTTAKKGDDEFSFLVIVKLVLLYTVVFVPYYWIYNRLTRKNRGYKPPPIYKTEEIWRPPPQRIPGSRPAPGTQPPPKPKPPEPPKFPNGRTLLAEFYRKHDPLRRHPIEFPPELRMAEDETLYWGIRTEGKPHGDGTAYVTERGKCWHLKKGCCGANKPMFLPAAKFKHRACSICVPVAQWDSEVPAWYREFLELCCDSPWNKKK